MWDACRHTACKDYKWVIWPTTMSLRNNSGFTIIELLTVIALLGILAGIAIVSMGNPQGLQSLAEAEALKANLRFTQSKAMSDLPGNVWSLNITAADYTIQRNGGVPNPAVNLPGSDSGTYTLPTGRIDHRGNRAGPVQFPGTTDCCQWQPGGPPTHYGLRSAPDHRHPGNRIYSMKNRIKSRNGFTLIELIATIAIAGIIMIMILPYFQSGITESHRPAQWLQDAVTLQRAMESINGAYRALILDKKKSDLDTLSGHYWPGRVFVQQPRLRHLCRTGKWIYLL